MTYLTKSKDASSKFKKTDFHRMLIDPRSNMHTLKNTHTLRDLVMGFASDKLEQEALVVKKAGAGKTLTYGDLQSEIISLGNALLKIGIKKGDKVAILSENRAEWPITYLAVTAIGAIAVPVDIFMEPGRITSCLAASDSQWLFTSSGFIKELSKSDDLFKIIKQIVSFDKDGIPAQPGHEGSDTGPVDGNQGLEKREIAGSAPFVNLRYVNFNSLIHYGRNLFENGEDLFSNIHVGPDDTAALHYMHDNIFVMLSHGGIIVNACSYLKQMLISGKYYQPGETSVAGLPFHHTYPLIMGIIVPFITYGKTIIPARTTVTDLIETLHTERVNYMATVPLIIDAMHKEMHSRKIKLPALKFIITGGAAIAPDLMQKMETLGIPVLQGYGLTEYSPIVSASSIKQNRIKAVGKPLPGVEVQIADKDEKGNGEIHVRGLSMMQGYYKMPDLTAKMMTHDGWLKTGDIGRIDEDGFLYITGRLKDIIVNSGGKNIYPEDIEACIAKSSYINQAVVVPKYSVHKGEVPYAVVYPDFSAISTVEKLKKKRFSETELHAFIKTEIQKTTAALRPYKVPREFGISLSKLSITEYKNRRWLFEEHNMDTADNMVSCASRRAPFGRSGRYKQNKRLQRRIADYIMVTAADLLGVSTKEIDEKAYFLDFIDSLGLIKIFEAIVNDVHVELNPTLSFEYSTIKDLSGYFADEFHKAFLNFLGEEPAESRDRQREDNDSVVNAFLPDNEQDHLPTFITDKVTRIHKMPIAIVGAGIRFPGSNTLDEFWQNLISGKNLISEIPKDRFDWEKYYSKDIEGENKMISKWGGFINDIDKFDPMFFNISPREAELMDPQQRIFMEVVWNTLEDAGYKPSSLSGTNTGLFVGVASHDYDDVIRRSRDEIEGYMVTGYSHAVLANRVSYFLNLYGPSESVDTACSGSLVAIQKAVKSIQNGDCKMAIAGGVNALITPRLFIALSKAGMLSPDGNCKTFDKMANGYVRGEGAGAIFLKPLDKAVRDGDQIYAVIRGAAVNHNGHASSLTAPNPKAQAELLFNAYKDAGCAPDTISYIEAHGTGTELGDPVEINGLKKAFRKLSRYFNVQKEKTGYCGIGSVKTNIGHLEAAAGIAGIIKVMLAMKYETLPASINYKTMNPYIKIDDSPFFILDKTRPWNHQENNGRGKIPRRAGVSSFGFGGSNAHIVLEEPISSFSYPIPETDEPKVVLLSAKNKDRLKAYAESMIEFLDRQLNGVGTDLLEKKDVSQNITLTDFAYTLQVGRDCFPSRLAVMVNSLNELRAKLNQFCRGDETIENLMVSNGNNGSADLEYLVDGEEGEVFLDMLIANRRLEKLTTLWLQGVDNIGWKSLYKDMNPKIVSLPTYPFARERYWKNISVTQSSEVIKAPETAETVKKEAYKPVCFRKAWIQSFRDQGKARLSGNMLLFDVNRKLFDRFVKTSKGENAANVCILVKPGKKFKQVHDTIFEINPEKAGDYNALFQHLKAENLLPDSVIHLWSQKRPADNTVQITPYLAAGFYALVDLYRHLLDIRTMHPIRLLYMYKNEPNHHQPWYAAAGGFAKSVLRETEQILMKVVDMRDSWSSLQIMDVIQKELNTGDHHDVMVKYENEHRYVEKFTACPVEKTDLSLSSLLKHNGVYLITGGAGGLGKLFAEHLARTVNARLVMTGRSAMSPEKQDFLNHLKTFKGEAVYIQADVSRKEDVKNLITEIRKKFQTLDGILHSAGVVKDGLIAAKKRSHIDQVVAPKVFGTLYLDAATKDLNLDFFALFSSLAAVMGNAGQSDYAFANAFMDDFASMRNTLMQSNKRSGKTIAVNWPLWRSGGMHVSAEIERWMKDAMGLIPLETENGLNIFNAALQAESSQLIVAHGDQAKISRSLSASGNIPIERKPAAPVSPQAPTVARVSTNIPIDVVNAELVRIFAGLLKASETDLDVQEDIADYGVDSLLMIRIIQRVNRKWDIDISPKDVVAYTTIHDISEYLLSSSLKDKDLGIPAAAESETHADAGTAGNDSPINDQKDVSKLTLESFKESRGKSHEEVTLFNQWLDEKKQSGIYSIETMRLGATGPKVEILRQTGETYEVINFANYNYLGYATHPKVIQAGKDALDKYGLGATASPLVSGMMDIHKKLEDTLLEYMGLEGCGITIFTSGFGALVGAISAYVGENDHVVMDTLSHASIVDGIETSGAQLHVFGHNDMTELEEILQSLGDTDAKVLICAEGVYSADGDYGNISGIVRLAKKYNAATLVDEAHSMLIAGPNGRGAVEEQGVLEDVDMVVGTFSKSFSGIGGFLFAKKELTQYVNFYARNRMFSCALDPAVTGGMTAAIEVAMTGEGRERREKLIDNGNYFRSLLKGKVDISDATTWIVPAIFGPDHLLFPIANFLQKNGLEGSMMSYPAVPANKARIRSFLSSEHSRKDLEKGAEIILKAAKEFGFLLK